MNEELVRLYRGLSTEAEAATQHHFKQSPRALAYLKLLEEGITATPRLVAYVYHDATEEVSHQTLVNRFYKLRSRVRVWLLQQMQHNQLIQLPEEQELTFLRLLVSKNEHLYALSRLQELAKRCWELNYFELLPDILELTFHTAYDCRALSEEERQTICVELQKAQQLLGVLHQLKHSFYYLVHNIEDYPNVINAMRRQIKSLKDYPRFALLYHYTAFSMGVHRPDLVERTSGAMVRHLNAYKRLRGEHPEVPIRELSPHYLTKSTAFFYSKESIFWYYKDKPDACIEALEQRRKVLEQNPDYLPNVSLSSLHNMIFFCLNAKAYDTANSYIQELANYQEDNITELTDNPHFVYEMLVYIDTFPKRQHPEPLALLEQVEAFLKEAPPEAAWTCVTLAEFALLYNKLEFAHRILDHPYFRQHLEEYASTPLYIDELIDMVTRADLEAVRQLITTIETTPTTSLSSHVEFHYRSLLHIAEQCALQLASL